MSLVRWALFFSRFNYVITYRPGSRNAKADAQSRRFAEPEVRDSTEPIIPSNLILSPLQWGIVDRINVREPVPANCPPEKRYVPASFQTKIINWSHRKPAMGHPGVDPMVEVVRRGYWWLSLRADVEKAVKSCTVCAILKPSRQLPTGKLMPLTVPQRPWSHLAVNFITDLKGYTVVLVVVDRFSNGVRFIPFPSPPTALTVAEALFQAVFLHYGIPEEILSNRGPQFVLSA